VQIELSYINTNHPDFTDGASLVSSIAMNHEMVLCVTKYKLVQKFFTQDKLKNKQHHLKLLRNLRTVPPFVAAYTFCASRV